MIPIVKYPVTKAFSPIVAEVSALVLEQIQDAETAALGVPSTIQGVNYYFGHIWELIMHLQEMSKDPDYKFLRFPLVWLPEDITYNINPTGYSTATIRLIICHHTNQDYKSEARETKVFEPVLRPIADTLLSKIADSRMFDISHRDTLEYSYTERKYWGRENLSDGNSANKLTDYVDAIDIERLELPLNDNCYFPQNIN